MTPPSQLSKADVRLFLQQLQANPSDVIKWEPMMRLSLLRGGLIDFTMYGRRVGSAPRLALMAVSQTALAFLAKHPRAPAINFTFDLPALPVSNKLGQADVMPAKRKMRDAQMNIHEAALVAISQWLTTLCTPTLVPLTGANFLIETCIHFICVHTLHAPEYVQHLTEKFIANAGKLALSSHQVTELVRSCRGDDDTLLIGLADKLIGKKLDSQIAATQLNIFLGRAGNELLKKKVETMEKEMGFTTKRVGSKAPVKPKTRETHSSFRTSTKRFIGRVHEIKDDEIFETDTDVVEIDADRWQTIPRTGKKAATPKRQKTTHDKDSAE